MKQGARCSGAWHRLIADAPSSIADAVAVPQAAIGWLYGGEDMILRLVAGTLTLLSLLAAQPKHSMASFNGPVRGDHVLPTARLQPNRDRCGGSGDESIQDDGHTCCGAAQHDAGHPGNLETADF